MSTFNIGNFKYGLDSRRDVLTSQPGTLVTCENAWINEGGEVVKRKGFFDLAGNTDVLDSNGATGTFGIEVTDSGLVAFGSALDYGASVTQSQPTLASALSGVTYQQLKHPTLVNDTSESYNASYHRMTSLVFSTNYNGKAFAIAQFSDGRRFLYYDGTHIQQSSNGLVMENRTALSDLSTDLLRQLQAIGWDGDANLDESGNAQNGSTLVESPQSTYYSGTPSETSTSGAIGIKFIAKDGASAQGTKAVASFQITGNSGTFTVEAPAQSTASTPTFDLCGGAITALGSAALTASAIVTAINDLTYVTGYTAIVNGANVFVYAPLDWIITYNLTVTYTTGGVGASAGSAGTLVATLSSENVTIQGDVVVAPTSENPREFIANVSITASGGSPSYSYAWTERVTGSGNGITIVGDAQKSAVAFRYVATGLGVRTGSFKCVVTDSLAATVEKIVTVNFDVFID